MRPCIRLLMRHKSFGSCCCYDVPAGADMHYLRANKKIKSKQNSYIDMSKRYCVDLKCPIKADGGKLTSNSLARFKPHVTPYFNMGWTKVVERGPFAYPQMMKRFDGTSTKSPKPTQSTFNHS